jgi:hypothetical protein
VCSRDQRVPATASRRRRSRQHRAFVAIQANPVEQAIINNVKGVAKADGAVASTSSTRTTAFRRRSPTATTQSPRQVRRVCAEGGGRPATDELRTEGDEGRIPVVAFGNALGPNRNTAARQIPGLSASVIELARINGQAVANLAAPPARRRARTRAT